MDPVDSAALKRALQTYRALSSHAAAEIAALRLKHGWQAAAVHAAQRLQRIAIGLRPHERAPCELEPTSPLADIHGPDDLRRGEMVVLCRRLLHLSLSKFEPSPLRAVEDEVNRRQALATKPGGDVA